MKTQEEIVVKAKAYAESIGNKDGLSAYDYVMGYNQCQEDMAKEEEVDVVCPKCKGVNEYIIIKKGDYKCAYTDCQHKFKQTRLI
jgi:phage FluMu protein Com